MNDRTNGIRLRAPAKINLGLEVLRRRSDGYHDINTLFAAIDLCDEIVLRPNGDGPIRCRVEGNEMLQGDGDNLCVRAAAMVRDRYGIGDGVDIELTKNIPIGAGLGGGSSDAAAVLGGVEKLWSVALDPREKEEMALALGSDVPFFLHGGIASATGQGEKLVSIAMRPDYHVLLVNPGIHVRTPWAYNAIGRSGERDATDLVEALRKGLDDPATLRDALVNDFEPAVFAAHPELAALKSRLYDAGALFALMSGSGATLFGLFPPDGSASAAAEHFDGVWTAVARFAPAA